MKERLRTPAFHEVATGMDHLKKAFPLLHKIYREVVRRIETLGIDEGENSKFQSTESFLLSLKNGEMRQEAEAMLAVMIREASLDIQRNISVSPKTNTILDASEFQCLCMFGSFEEIVARLVRRVAEMMHESDLMPSVSL